MSLVDSAVVVGQSINRLLRLSWPDRVRDVIVSGLTKLIDDLQKMRNGTWNASSSASLVAVRREESPLVRLLARCRCQLNETVG